MIEVTYRCEVEAVEMAAWLERYVRPALTPDFSSYAKGRLRCWLGEEPSLTAPFRSKPAFQVSDSTIDWLSTAIRWRFDYCLVTYSGDEAATGILPHRDAGYADYEARGWNVSGACTFRYWNGRESYGKSPDLGRWPSSGPPSHVLELKPGEVIRFNCKNMHSAEPQPRRWGMNFWRAKQ